MRWLTCTHIMLAVGRFKCAGVYIHAYNL